MSETQDKTVREKLLDALKAESDQFTTEELIDQLIADRRRAKLEAYDHRQDLDDLRRVTQEARRVLVDALGEVTLTWSLDSLVRGVVESHTKYRKSYTEARSALIDALGEALTDWSLEDLVKAIIDQRDSWQRVAREQDAKEQDAKDDGVAELLRKTVKSPADEILELHAEIERLKDEIERLKDRAASVPAVLKSQADELLELYAEIERLKDCADSVPAVLNSTLTKTKEDLGTAKLETDRLDQALTRVNTVLSRFGVPRLAEGEHGPRMLEAHERVSILGVNAAQAKERADKSEALLATVAAADDFEKRAEKTAEYVDREDDTKFERVVWCRRYAKHRMEGLVDTEATEYADLYLEAWREGTRKWREPHKSEFLRAAEHDATIDGLTAQVKELEEKVKSAEACAQESADIMRRARDRAQRATDNLHIAVRLLERVVQWYGRTDISELATEIREIYYGAEALVEKVKTAQPNLPPNDDSEWVDEKMRTISRGFTFESIREMLLEALARGRKEDAT